MVDVNDVEASGNVFVMKSRALTGLFTRIRDRETKPQEYVHYSKRLMRILAEEAITYLPISPATVMTPTHVPYSGHLSIIDTDPDNVCAVSIVRAGDSLLESLRECAPAVRVGKMWIQRDESSREKNSVHSCTKLPKGIDDMDVILCDPMLATGGSSIEALRTLVEEYGVKQERIVFANVISCPEGLTAVGKAFPRVKIVTAWVDEGLNEEKFILPGLGDYGDRFFNTV